MKNKLLRLIILAVVTVVISVQSQEVMAFSSPQQSTRKAAGKKSNMGSTRRRGNATKKAESSNKGGDKKNKLTSSEVKKEQEATQREIQLTEQKIKENERKVKDELKQLGKLETDISVSKNRIAATSTQINSLSGQINALETEITTNEKELERLREEYLKVVKKMRLAREGNSMLSFVFASDNFNQALRRMRYLKQFSEWKDRRSELMAQQSKQLKSKQQELSNARDRHNEALKRQRAEESSLQSQYTQQNLLVANLKQNGTALKSHLAKKQTEANQLRNRISELIAEEQRAAEAKRKEAEAKARKEAEAKAKKEAEEKTRKENEQNKQAASGKEQGKKEQGNKGKGNKEGENVIQKEDKGNNYANARKRKPRGEKSKENENKEVVHNGGNDFASMKGRLPRPASGAFKVTSRFGRQSMPELPDIVYDNPGIDAEVGAGSSALAVYSGKVSGVYMLPGYNTVVILNHNNYYTVYGNISSPSVKIGDTVTAGQKLGVLAPDEDDESHSSIHFEVWRNRDKLNPLEWIH